MKTSLDHLPEAKRQELERVLEVLFRAFDEATRARTAPHRQGRILKVVLFGSYARGDWVADPIGGYTSDYDLLVVVSSDELTDVTEYWMEADRRLQQAYEVAHQLTAPAHFIVHSLADVNRQLSRGRPFFVDIVRDGVLLHQSDDAEFARPEKLSPAEAYAQALENFEEWFPSARRFLQYGRDGIERGWPKEAAFQLHQGVERLYHCLLLTQTLYSSKSHNLNFLRSQAERVAPEIIPAWPRGSKFKRRTWELLRRAYVEARFSRSYAINAEELAWLADRAEDLRVRVERSCRAYLSLIWKGGQG
ncbi:MAG: HEPN domain-containing protein [Phenylobacterium sp.]|nr:HEPN domain-containing protein [Phenylobacterium sp.]